MKNKITFVVLLLSVILVAGCLGNSSNNAENGLAQNDKNVPPTLPDETSVSTTADNGVPSLPNAGSAESDSPSDNPPPVPAILGLRKGY